MILDIHKEIDICGPLGALLHEQADHHQVSHPAAWRPRERYGFGRVSARLGCRHKPPSRHTHPRKTRKKTDHYRPVRVMKAHTPNRHAMPCLMEQLGGKIGAYRDTTHCDSALKNSCSEGKALAQPPPLMYGTLFERRQRESGGQGKVHSSEHSFRPELAARHSADSPRRTTSSGISAAVTLPRSRNGSSWENTASMVKRPPVHRIPPCRRRKVHHLPEDDHPHHLTPGPPAVIKTVSEFPHEELTIAFVGGDPGTEP